MIKMFSVIFAAIILCTGCAFYSNTDIKQQNVEHSSTANSKKINLIDYSYHAMDLLLQRLSIPVDKSKRILVASLANTDNLEESSTFGRTVSDQYVSYLVNQGYTVSEIKLRNDLLLKKKEGEFMLSRDVRKILRTQNVQAVVVGTYSIGFDNVYVTAKLINPVDNIIVSAVDYKIWINNDIRTMLKVN